MQPTVVRLELIWDKLAPHMRKIGMRALFGDYHRLDDRKMIVIDSILHH
jgi:hypothetical protein